MEDDPLSRARSALAEAQRHVADEIRAYPTPVAGCDAQFNHLLDLRQRLRLAMAALERETVVPTSRAP